MRSDTLVCPTHGPFVVPPGYAATFREGDGFEVACPVLDENGNPHYVPARIERGAVVAR